MDEIIKTLKTRIETRTIALRVATEKTDKGRMDALENELRWLKATLFRAEELCKD